MYGAPGYNKNWRDVTGRAYSEIKWERCVCQNAKPTDRALCDRCTALAERGWRVIFAA